MNKKALIRAALFTPLSGGRMGLPLLFWAPPGVAKTSIIEEVVAECSLPLEVLSPGERGEGAFGVVPVPVTTETGLVLSYPAPDWAATRFPGGRGVVFVDEITTAPPALQAPLMGLFLARRVGSYQLPPGVRVLAAANPPELAAGGYDLTPPVANRMGHIDWPAPTVDEHAAFMMRGSTGVGGAPEQVVEADEEEGRVLGAWPTAFAQAVGLELSFLRARPTVKNVCPKPGDPKIARAWPSDRTWEFATRAYASSLVHALDQMDRETFVSAFVGAGVASEFFSFIEKQDLPNPADVLDGKVKFAHDSKRIDRTVAVLSSCTALVTPKDAAKRSERAKAVWALMDEILGSAKALEDIVIPQIISLIDGGLHTFKEATKILAKVQPVLSAADIKFRR